MPYVHNHPQNVIYPPVVGDTWFYNDTNREHAQVGWYIASISEDGTKTKLIKQTGENRGFERMYDISALKDPESWRPLHTKAEPIYLWPCPSCEEDKPVPIGDYVCEDCRSGLDTEG